MRLGRVFATVVIGTAIAAPSALAADKAGDAPNVKVVVNNALSSPTKLVLDVTLPGKKHTTQVLYKAPDGNTYVKIGMPGLTTSFDPKQSLTAGLGTPGVPALSIPFAIPQSANQNDRLHGVFAKVSAKVLQAYYDDISLKQPVFPALKAPLDGPSAATGHTFITSSWTQSQFSECSISALRAIPTCWGTSQWPPSTTTPNLIQEWLTNPPDWAKTQVDQIMHGQWNQMAVSTNALGHLHTAGANPDIVNEGCVVGQNATDVAYGVNINRLQCFALNPEDGKNEGVSNFPWMVGIGDGPHDVPAYDIKQVEATHAGNWPNFRPGQFCVLRNFGTTDLPSGYTPGHGEVRCFGGDDGDRSPWGSDWSDPPMTDPVTGEQSHYTQISIGGGAEQGTACGLLATGHARCWAGWWLKTAPNGNREGPLYQPEMTQIAMGYGAGCGIRKGDSHLFCWGTGDDYTKRLTNISASSPEDCVSKLGVWVPDGYPTSCVTDHINTPPSLASLQVKFVSQIGRSNTICVVDLQDYVHCDNFANPIDPANPPAAGSQPWAPPSFVQRNKFVSVDTRNVWSTCGVTVYERVFCWPTDQIQAKTVPAEVNSPIAWHDPLFKDFVDQILYQNMPDDLLRPFKQDGLTYGSPLPIPSGTVTKSGGAIGSDNAVSGAAPTTSSKDAPSKGGLRGLGLGQLYLYGGQYTPKTKKLRVFSKIRVEIDFENPQLDSSGKALFGDKSVSAPSSSSFRQVVGSTLVNADTALAQLTPQPAPRKRKVNPSIASTPQCGEDMLVVTAPEFQSQADAFAAAKNSQGLLTTVVTTADPRVGNTADSIRNFVQGEVANTSGDCVAPAYLTLLGNTAKVPTFTGDANTTSTPSDIDYTLPSLNTYVPDMAVGRLPAATSEQATAMVNKIIAYENSAPTSDAGFYNNVTITSFFQNEDPLNGQDTRGFIRSAEQLRNGLMAKGAGMPAKTVERLYSTSNPTSRIKLTKDDLGRPFPSDLNKTPGQAPWNAGSQGSIIKSITAGRFLVISRDHGDFDRIFNPAYGNFPAPGSGLSSVDQMSNGSKEPVAWLIACLAGSYDNPKTPSFAESMLARPAGGMVGVLAASRVSPSEPNNSLLLALGDAVWPSILPTGNAKPIYRMGDVLNAAKLQVLMSGGPKGSYDINNEMRLYNWFGDPSMQLWTQKPSTLPLTVVSSGIHPDYASVSFTTPAADGAKAILLGPGDKPIGSTIIKGTAAAVSPANGIADSGPLSMVIVKDQALPTKIVLRR